MALARPDFMAKNSESSEEKKAPASGAIKAHYGSAQLGKLEGLEAVRKKPGMYIGGTDERALHHCVSEVLDNSVDEHLAGHCDKIEVTIHVDGSISIRDNGRGIPVDIHPQYKIPGVEMVLTTLHSGGKYGQGGYKFSGGTHGVGAKCVNAVSRMVRGGGLARRRSASHGIRARQDDSKTSRHRQNEKHRHAHHLQARPGNFPRHDRIQGGHHFAAVARAGVFEFGPGDHFCWTNASRT